MNLHASMDESVSIPSRGSGKGDYLITLQDFYGDMFQSPLGEVVKETLSYNQVTGELSDNDGFNPLSGKW